MIQKRQVIRSYASVFYALFEVFVHLYRVTVSTLY